MTLLGRSRKRLYHALEHYDRNDRASVIISSMVVGVIAVNLIAIILESIPAFARDYGAIFFAIELVSCFFLIEYVLRIWVYVEQPARPMHHPKQNAVLYGSDSGMWLNRCRLST